VMAVPQKVGRLAGVSDAELRAWVTSFSQAETTQLMRVCPVLFFSFFSNDRSKTPRQATQLSARKPAELATSQGHALLPQGHESLLEMAVDRRAAKEAPAELSALRSRYEGIREMV